MRIGKIPENVLNRSVIRKIKSKQKDLISGATMRDFCAVFCTSETDCVLTCTQQVIAPTPSDTVRLSIQRALNCLAANQSTPIGISLALSLPESFTEPELASLMQEADEKCKENGVAICGGSTITDPSLNSVRAVATGIGKRAEKQLCKVQAGWSLLLTKKIALPGTAILAREKKEELLKRYPLRYFEEAMTFDTLTSVLPEAATAMKSDVCRMFPLSEGGIFGSLWEFSRSMGVGLHIDLKKIPIFQESVEICDYFGLNPYEMMSDGALLIATPQKEHMMEAFCEAGIPVTEIGYTTSDNGKVIENEEETRYVDRPSMDEIYKIL